ncbi:MAG: hypothetical protein ACREPD_02040 [Stenotrophomonas sp.]|uniref:hypothetical protein n=1 Tax=Stenotrophomonas sp. TaxID=69392 RepID=UPI003D6CD129
MAQRNWFGQATGRAGERILLGSNNYDPRTGQYRNVVPGLIGRAAQTVIGAFGGPLIGAVAGRGISKLVDRYGKDPQFVQPEAIPIPVDWGAPQSAMTAFTAPTPMAAPPTSNLGLGPQAPGNTWAGYLQSQGSVNNFGNTQFGSGMASVPGSWSPSSQWGQQITAQPAAPGSNLGFGNNAQQFAGGGGGGGGGGSSMGGSRMGGIVGGRLANDSMLDVQRRWASK